MSPPAFPRSVRLARRVFIALCCLAPSVALAAYPDRPIHLLVPFDPGSASDTLMRIVGDELQRSLGQPVVIENKPGALTSIALNQAARAAPDGYTLVMTTNSMVANPAGIQRKVTYDPFRDFTPISRLATTSYALVVPADKPWKSWNDLVEYGHAHPGQLSYASGNLGGQVYGGMLAKLIDPTMTRVPYNSTPQGLLDLMAGQVQLMVTDIVTAAAQVKSGKLRALLVTAPKPNPDFPGVPTVQELKLDGVVDMPAWLALFGPAGMPPEVVARLNHDVVAVLAQPKVAARLASLGLEPAPSTPQEMADFMKSQSDSYVRLIKELHIR